ncbi:MAG: hypothetical protein ACJ8AY_08530 [Gemmatimonadales bacterium]
MQSWCGRAVLAATLVLAACSETPSAPPDALDADGPDLRIITPVILPAGADWGLYFQSFNQTRSLTTRVIHYPDGSVSGSGIFAIPLVGTGILRVTGATPYGNCIPQGSPCGTVTNIPESAVATGTARFLSGPRAGQQVPFTLDLHSTFFPDQTSVFDRATLRFCSASSSCRSYSFFGELHHEPQ